MILTGNTFSLICNVTTDEDLVSGLSVGWYSDSNPVMNTATRTVLSQDGASFKSATLMFDSAVMEDEGNYSCNYNLTIQGSSEPPLTDSSSISVGTNSKLQWINCVKGCHDVL